MKKLIAFFCLVYLISCNKKDNSNTVPESVRSIIFNGQWEWQWTINAYSNNTTTTDTLRVPEHLKSYSQFFEDSTYVYVEVNTKTSPYSRDTVYHLKWYFIENTQEFYLQIGSGGSWTKYIARADKELLVFRNLSKDPRGPIHKDFYYKNIKHLIEGR